MSMTPLCITQLLLTKHKNHMFTGARINRILAGSNEIMKYVIGRDIFGDEYNSMLD